MTSNHNCRFYGAVKGHARTMASRRGFRKMSATINGKTMGIMVGAYVNENNKNVFDIYATGGFNSDRASRLIKTIIDNDS